MKERPETPELPSADAMERFALSKEWSYLDMDEPREAWESFHERVRREMAGHQKLAAQLRKEASDAFEQAQAHDERAAEFWNLLNALRRAPITFPADETP